MSALSLNSQYVSSRLHGLRLEAIQLWDMTRNTVNRVRSFAVDLGVSSDFVYVNYVRAGQANEVFAGYGEENAERSRDIQTAVDTRGIFILQGLWRGFMKLQ